MDWLVVENLMQLWVNMWMCRRLFFAGENPVQSIPITLSNNAVSHLQKLKAEKNNDDLMLRIGVRSGGVHSCF